MSKDRNTRTRVIGWGPFRLPGEKRRRAEASEQAAADLLRAHGSVDKHGQPVPIDWDEPTP